MGKAPLLLAFALGACQQAAEPEKPETRFIQDGRMALQSVEGHDVIVEELDIDAGLDVETHKHAGPEILTVVEGSATLQLEGEAPMVLAADKTFHIPRETYHRATIGPDGAKIIVIRIHPRGDEVHIAPDREVVFPE